MAYLPGQSTFEMSITSGKFEADMFVMANAENFKKLTAAGNDVYEMGCTEVLRPVGGIVSLAHKPIATTISIAYPDADGKMAPTTSDPTAGEYKLVTPSGTEPWKIQFYETDVAGVDVTISYYYDLVEAGEDIEESKIDNRSSAIGEAIMIYPVYGSGEDCSDSSIIGNVIVKVYRARVTAAPGFDASYKQAATFQFTLSAINYCGLAA